MNVRSSLFSSVKFERWIQVFNFINSTVQLFKFMKSALNISAAVVSVVYTKIVRPHSSTRELELLNSWTVENLNSTFNLDMYVVVGEYAKGKGNGEHEKDYM